MFNLRFYGKFIKAARSRIRKQVLSLFRRLEERIEMGSWWLETENFLNVGSDDIRNYDVEKHV